MLHDEGDGIAALATAKAVAGAARRGYIERWRLLVMKRAQSLIIRSTFAQCNKLRDYVDDISRILYLFYCLSVYHRYSRNLSAKIGEKTDITKKMCNFVCQGLATYSCRS